MKAGRWSRWWRRWAWSASCSRAAPTSSPTRRGSCARATRRPSASARTRSAPPARSSRRRWTPPWRPPACRRGPASLVDSAERAAGWAMFCDKRLALAVARGSGRAVAQLGGVARQTGLPVSLHGTGGAWIVADETADAERFAGAVLHSLDRKVCNTLNVCCIHQERAGDLVPVFLNALERAGRRRGGDCKLHVVEGDESWLPARLDSRPRPAWSAPRARARSRRSRPCRWTSSATNGSGRTRRRSRSGSSDRWTRPWTCSTATAPASPPR